MTSHADDVSHQDDGALDLMVHNLMHWIGIPAFVEILPGTEIIDNNNDHEVSAL
jgi:hypothetical protein